MSDEVEKRITNFTNWFEALSFLFLWTILGSFEYYLLERLYITIISGVILLHLRYS
jgi:hypothetical protein